MTGIIITNYDTFTWRYRTAEEELAWLANQPEVED